MLEGLINYLSNSVFVSTIKIDAEKEFPKTLPIFVANHYSMTYGWRHLASWLAINTI